MTEQQLMAWAVAEMLAGRLRRSRAVVGTLWWRPSEPVVLHRGLYRTLSIMDDAQLAAVAAGNYERWSALQRSIGAHATKLARQLADWAT